jgi:hypothetical protein
MYGGSNKKRITIGLVAVVAFLFGVWGVITIQYDKKIYYQDLDIALREKATQGYLDSKILEAIAADQFDDAVMYQNLAEYLGVTLNTATLAEIEKHNNFLSKSWRNAKHFGEGFFSGEAEDAAGLTGAIASDLTIVGDLRDLASEGSKFTEGKPYDKLIFGMSIIGVGMSVSQFFSFGMTTPAKVGASIIKIAKKTHKLSDAFIGTVLSKLSKAIDFKALKKVDFSSINSIKKETKRITKSLNKSFIRKSFNSINTIKKNTDSYADTITLMKYIDTPKDLNKVAKVSKKYKKNTKAVFKVLGKSTIRGIVKGTARIVKWTTLLIAQIISLIVSIVMAILVFPLKWSIGRKIKNFIGKRAKSKSTGVKKSFEHNQSIELRSEDNSLPGITVKAKGKTIIGRGDKSDVTIVNRYVSRQHLRIILKEDGGLIVEDLNSANGTYIDGRKLEPGKPTLLNRGERLIIGSEDVVYKI